VQANVRIRSESNGDRTYGADVREDVVLVCFPVIFAGRSGSGDRKDTTDKYKLHFEVLHNPNISRLLVGLRS
jgi:hypothetical protein